MSIVTLMQRLLYRLFSHLYTSYTGLTYTANISLSCHENNTHIKHRKYAQEEHVKYTYCLTRLMHITINIRLHGWKRILHSTERIRTSRHTQRSIKEGRHRMHASGRVHGPTQCHRGTHGNFLRQRIRLTQRSMCFISLLP